ncbi:MAG: hypothetical protein ACYCSZ_07060 [Burkholderiales bacterium]
MTTKPTTVEFDPTKITSLLGKTNEAKDFAQRIQSIFKFDKYSQRILVNYPKTASEQINILAEIIDKCDALLKALKPLGLNDISHLKYADFETAKLLQHHRWLIAREKRIARDSQSNEKQHLDLLQLPIDIEKIKATLFIDVNNYTTSKIAHEKPDNPTDLDYPNQVFYSVLELKEIATHAAEKEKPGKGNSSKRNSESIRKKKLAIGFVSLYLDCFNKLPPMTANGRAHQAFDYCLYFADFPEEVKSINSFKEAIKEFKPKEKLNELINTLTESQSKT